MARILLVIANKYTNQSYLIELVQSNLLENDCIIWSNTPVCEGLLQTKAKVIGPGIGKSFEETKRTKSTGLTRTLSYPFLVLKVLHKMLLTPITCAWRLNFTRFRVKDSHFDVIMAADAQAVLSVWAYGKKHSHPQLLSVKKVIS